MADNRGAGIGREITRDTGVLYAFGNKAVRDTPRRDDSLMETIKAEIREAVTIDSDCNGSPRQSNVMGVRC
ncbi:hypothetical protein [Sphingomicrobium aestuariivivum]|uniref:hypothetical protein n=1 Tax=Sphingomicrobium aestuariivivum TaxID=1582356 RepID=UPI001FD71D4D|nr:hypothetical protein [Sphingomicrobium aestuariivivum]MCJ8192048.1 hypothetical protein [Sphingomicrobium aestuariivivum]